MSSRKWMAAALLSGWLSAGTMLAQDAHPAQPPPATASNAPAAAEQSPPAQGTGKVLFSRSEDDSTADVSPSGAPPKQGGADRAAAEGQATAEERESPVFLAYDLDIHLVPRQESVMVRARMTLRNDGQKPLKRIALQLSSSLKWDRIRTGEVEARFAQHPVDGDADHTGSVNEAVITLPVELAPGQELKVEAFYGGQISLNAERLERIGAPDAAAEKSDWDRVSADFVGLRGFGNVIWYPVSASPVTLGAGEKFFAEIGRQKQRQQQARVSMTVTAEYSADMPPPNLALLDGHLVPVVQTSAPEDSYPGVVTATLPGTTLGFATPSLFLLNRRQVDGEGIQLFVSPEDLVAAQSYLATANTVLPLVRQWLGSRPLILVSLPDPDDVGAEEGNILLTGFKASPEAKEQKSEMLRSFTRASFRSPRVWLDEGVPQFMDSLWLEQSLSRQSALEALSTGRVALALAEPSTPGEAAGQDLLDASDIVYYRTKATYVFWMLRGLVGDARLAAALQAYVPEEDTTQEYFERLLEKSSGTDLKWFFDSWIYHDRGLPDLSITGVFPSKSAVEGQWLVAIDIANDGYAEVEVPVTVLSNGATVTERLRVPARGKVSHRMLTGGRPTEIQLNDGTVPEVQDSLHIRKLTIESP